MTKIQNRGRKYHAAMLLVKSGKFVLWKGAKPGQMNPDNLYTVLRAAGWSWRPSAQEWQKDVKIETSPTPEPTMPEPITDSEQRFYLRIIAPAGELEPLTSSLTIAFDLLRWEIIGVVGPKEYAGDSGEKYYYFTLQVPR